MEDDRKRTFGVAAIAAAAAGSAALLLGPSIVSAQEADPPAEEEAAPEEDAAPEDDEAEECEGPRGRHFPGPRLEAAAAAIGIEEDALREALRDGQTLAEVADANDVDPQTVVDALVAEAEERLAAAVEDGRMTQERADERLADLPERMQDLVEGELVPRGRGHGHPFGDRLRERFGPGDGSEEAPSDDAEVEPSVA